jgi:succinate dehydrogenase / fumarate reductase membrane anchor subunit
MRFSPFMLLQYASGILIAVLGGIHIASHSFLGVESFYDSLTFLTVMQRFWTPFYTFTLEALLVTVAYHGFNGSRSILLELRQGIWWDRSVTWLSVALGFTVVVYGTRTILIASFGWG